MFYLRSVLNIRLSKIRVLVSFAFLSSSNLYALDCVYFDSANGVFQYYSAVTNATDCDVTNKPSFILVAPADYDALSTSEPVIQDNSTLPTPQAIAEAWGSGFIVSLPVCLAIFGGRKIIKTLNS